MHRGKWLDQWLWKAFDLKTLENETECRRVPKFVNLWD